LSQSTNAKVVVIGSGKDGLPIILGNVDTPAPPAGSTPPSGTDTMNKESTTAAGPAVAVGKKTPAGLATPTGKITPANPPAAAPEASRSFWPLSLSDIETYLYQIIRPEPEPTPEPKAEPRSRQPSDRPLAAQPQ